MDWIQILAKHVFYKEITQQELNNKDSSVRALDGHFSRAGVQMVKSYKKNAPYTTHERNVKTRGRQHLLIHRYGHNWEAVTRMDKAMSSHTAWCGSVTLSGEDWTQRSHGTLWRHPWLLLPRRTANSATQKPPCGWSSWCYPEEERNQSSLSVQTQFNGCENQT